MFNNLRKPLKPLIDAIAYPFSWIHPDILSFGSFLVAAPGFYFYFDGNSLLGSLFVLGALFDTIDGAVARKRGGGTKFGGVLDATLDRVFEGLLIMFIGLGGFVEWWLLVLFLNFSVGVSYIKAKAEAAAGETTVGTNKFSVGIAQRGERIAMIFGASILNYFFSEESNVILEITFYIITIASLVTLIWRGWMIRSVLNH